MKTNIRTLIILLICMIFLIMACAGPQVSDGNGGSSSSSGGNTGSTNGVNNSGGGEGEASVPEGMSAVMSELEGFVEFKEVANADFIAAKNGDTLYLTGQVQTSNDGRTRLTFSDGAIIRLGPSSMFTFEAVVGSGEKDTTKIKLDWGSLFIILQGGALDVDTQSGVASVTGSYMEVRIDPVTGDVIITCLEGVCEVETEGGTVTITAGQSATIKSEDLPPEVGEMTDEDILRWLQNNPEATAVIVPMQATVDAWKAATAQAEAGGDGGDDDAPTATATLPPPQITMNGDYVCYSGPKTTGYDAVGTLFAGQTLNVVGQSNTHWIVEFPGYPGILCWVPKVDATANETAGFVSFFNNPPKHTPTPKPEGGGGKRPDPGDPAPVCPPGQYWNPYYETCYYGEYYGY